MTRAAKVTLLAAILVILAFAVGQLRQQGGGYPPPASVSGNASTSNAHPASSQRVRQQPTILQARPALDANGFRPNASPRNGELPESAESTLPQRPSDNLLPSPAHVPDTPPRAPDPTFQGESWPVSQKLGIPSPFQLDQLGAGRVPAESSVDGMPPTALPSVVRPPVPNQRPASIPATEHDSFWNISLRVYGVGDYYKALYYHNRERVRRPDMIQPGLAIVTPSPDELRRLYPHLCPEPENR
ncbi:MAG: LysM peptidoglycan-binding domain-containing protein [Pirellulaceae bacterium]